MRKIILLACLMPTFLCASDLPLKFYLQERIDEISKEMSRLNLNENYQTELRWVSLQGKLNAYYDIYYRFANHESQTQ